MVWVHKNDDGSTELVGYDKGMRIIARLIENGDDWSITSKNGDTYSMKGSACPDPIDFIFKLISPVNPNPDGEDIPYLRFQNDSTGECWEVWAVK